MADRVFRELQDAHERAGSHVDLLFATEIIAEKIKTYPCCHRSIERERQTERKKQRQRTLSFCAAQWDSPPSQKNFILVQHMSNITLRYVPLERAPVNCAGVRGRRVQMYAWRCIWQEMVSSICSTSGLIFFSRHPLHWMEKWRQSGAPFSSSVFLSTL